MSNTRFIEISSSFRNRNEYPDPSNFIIPFQHVRNQMPSENTIAAYSYNDSLKKIVSKTINTYDTVTNGIVDYLWKDNYSQGVFNNDNSNGNVSDGIITFSGPNPIDFINGSILVITDGVFVGLSVITSATYSYDNYIYITFNPSINLLQPVSYTYQYSTYTEGGTILEGTNTSVIVKELSTPYQNVIDFYTGYQLNIYSVSSQTSVIIKSYIPSKKMFTFTQPIDFISTNMYFTISNPSTKSSIVLPGIDSCGKTISSYYNDFYIIDETLSIGTKIVYSKINYNFLNRKATLLTPFPNQWNVADMYSLRKTLPDEILYTVNFSGSITNSVVSTKTYLHVIGLYPSYRYKGFRININNIIYTIDSSDVNNSILTIDSIITLSTFPIPFTLLPPIFQKIPEYPQLTLSNCIFLPEYANSSDNYYTGKYIYIYPAKTSSKTQLKNIRGSCFYIYAYVGNGYNACFLRTVETVQKNGSSEYYPSYINEMPVFPPEGSLIDIVSFSNDNFNPLIYNGSVVSQQELVAYEIYLNTLVLPNLILSSGSQISKYSHLYVEFNVLHSFTNTIYSNNPNSNKALFLVPITDIKHMETSTFIKLNSRTMVQTIKFKPNDSLQFSVYFPDGKLFTTIMSDYYSPSSPNPLVQIEALFSIIRL